jgi:hypothetical protein
MKVALLRSRFPIGVVRRFVSVICALALLPGDGTLMAHQSADQNPPAAVEQAATIPPEQLDSLVAPIALYPDPLLSQTLVASTYPLEIIQLQQWLGKNNGLKDKALADAVQKQPWDASIQAMAALPDVVKQLAENIKWTTDLGNAFLAQQNDVMAAVQRMRKKAKEGGNLKSSEQQKVETKVVESQQVIVIEQSNPEVIYVPSYNPTVVYGAAAYPYPPIAYPPPGYYAAGMAISFGVGLAMGAAWGGGWGYGCGWGGNNNVYINNNNNFVRNSNANINRNQNINRSTARSGGNSSWQHNPQHRGGAPYSNGATAKKYGGTARGDSMTTRQANARQNQGQRGGLQQAGDRGSAEAGTRDRGTAGNRQPGANDRSSGGRDSANRSAAASNTSAGRGGGDRVGNRSTSSGGGSRNSSAFGGSSGSSGKSARASSSRGSSSMRSGGGGGRSGGGGGRRR